MIRGIVQVVQLHNTNVTPHSLFYLQSIDACLDILLLIFVYPAVMHNLILIHTNLKPKNIPGNCWDWNKVNVDILGNQSIDRHRLVVFNVFVDSR